MSAVVMPDATLLDAVRSGNVGRVARGETPLAPAQVIGMEAAERALARRRAAKVEDLLFMVYSGETTEGAARRLGYTAPASLLHMLRAWGCTTIWEALQRNEIRRYGATLGEVARRAKSTSEKGRPARRSAA